MDRGRLTVADNIYARCRKTAAEYDSRLQTRETASEELDCSIATLSDIELGIRSPQPYMCIRMADRYKSPELLDHYCAKECNIGKIKGMCEAEVTDLDRITIKVVNALKESDDLINIILEIAADGEISVDEEDRLNMISRALDNIAKASNSLKLFAAKSVKRPIDDMKNKCRNKK